MGDRLQAIEAGGVFASLGDKYGVSARLGLLNNVIRQWMDVGMQETPEQMVEYLLGCMLAF